jgi:hypothetical protein
MGYPSLRLKSGSARDDPMEERSQECKLRHYPRVLLFARELLDQIHFGLPVGGSVGM